MPGELMRKLAMDDTPNMSKKPPSDLDLYLVVSSILPSLVLAGPNGLHSPEKTPYTSKTSFAIPVA